MQIHLLSKWNAQIDTCGTFALIHRHLQTGENFDLPDMCVPSWWSIKQHSTLLFQLSCYTEVSFSLSTLCHFLAFVCFFLVLLSLIWSPSILLKCFLVFLSARRLSYTLWRKYVCQINFIQARVIALLAMSTVLTNQQYTEKKLLLNRNTHGMYSAVGKNVGPDAQRNLSLQSS